MDMRNAWLFPGPGSAMHLVKRFTGSGYSFLNRTYALGPIRAAAVVKAEVNTNSGRVFRDFAYISNHSAILSGTASFQGNGVLCAN